MERWQKAMAHLGNAPCEDLPTVLATEGPHGPVVYGVNRAARLAGIAPGARVVDMRALCPELRVEYADVAGDRVLLDRLRLWVRRWCPWSAVDGEDGLILDTTGSDHLFGGEAALLVDIETQFSRLGLTAQPAIAPTWGAAWGLARYGPVRAVAQADRLDWDLSALPIKALRLTSETELLLHRLGLKTIGALADIPRLSLTRRFVKAPLPANPLLRLDQAMGRLAEPVASQEALPPFRVHSRLPEPIQDPTAYLPQLCDGLCAQLDHRGHGCRRLRLTVYRTDGEISQLEVATSTPSREAAHLSGLFGDRLERINPGDGFDLITLEAPVTEPIVTAQPRLDGAVEAGADLSRLVDRLTARFGPRSVTRPVLKESHVPERAEGRVAALAEVPAQGVPPVPAAPRPIRLLHPPEEIRVLYAVPEGPPAQFLWRRQTHKVSRYAGPERIAPEWWHDTSSTRLRDYFRVEDHTGRRLWLYREGLHGDGRGGAPRWFVHGMFA